MQAITQETDENCKIASEIPKRFMAATVVSASKQKVLAEKNSGEVAETMTPQVKRGMVLGRAEADTQITTGSWMSSSSPLSGRGLRPYDPKTNYTMPRPEFLRYNPDRRREILLRVEREMEEDAEFGSDSGAPSNSTSAAESSDSSQESVSEYDEQEADEETAHQGRCAKAAWRLFLLLVALVSSFCYISCMNSAPVPASQEHLDFVGKNASMYDLGVRPVAYGRKDSAGNFMPIAMTGLLDMRGEANLREFTCQIGDTGSGKVVGMGEWKNSPGNFMAIETMGLSDVCPDVNFGEFTCLLGDASSAMGFDPQEMQELEEQKSAVLNGSYQNLKLSEVALADETMLGDSAGYPANVGGSNSELLNQEEGEDCTNRSELQADFMYQEKDLESEKLDVEMDIESEKLNDQNTAEAETAIKALVESGWPTLRFHLLQMLACLSVVSVVTALYKYLRKSPKARAYVSCHSPSPQPVRVLKPEPIISLEVPMMEHMDRKVQEPDVDSQKASNNSVVELVEYGGFRPPMVELLGEISFADAAVSRARSVKELHGSGGDDSVEELWVSVRRNAAKKQNESTAVQSPSVQRPQKEENGEKGENKKMDATPTPLRRSSRLRNRVSSP